MGKTIRFWAIISLLLAAVSAAVADPVTLEYKFKKGDVDKYRVGVEMKLDLSDLAAFAGKTSIPPTDMSISMTLIQKTIDVYSDGSAKVKVTYCDPVIQGVKMPAAASKSAKALQGQAIIMRISKRGSTMSVEGLGKLTSASGIRLDFSKFMDVSSGSAFLPDGPVELGQSWSENIPIPFGNSQLCIQSTFAGDDEEIWNLRVARIRQNCSGRLDLKAIVESVLSSLAASTKQTPPDLSSMSGDLTLNGQMTNYFAPSIGKLLKSDGNLDAKITVTLPPALTKQGAPPTLSCGVNLRMAMSRFN